MLFLKYNNRNLTINFVKYCEKEFSLLSIMSQIN